MDVRGMVFRNEHETNGEKWYSYNLSISSKNQNGEWESGSLPIRFMKGVDVPNKTRIEITDGWLKPYKFGDKFVIGIFCKGYEVLNDPQGEIHGYSALVQDDVPF